MGLSSSKLEKQSEHLSEKLIDPVDPDGTHVISVHNEESAKKTTSDEEQTHKIPYLQIFRFATPFDLLMIFLGVLGSIVNGLALPAFALIFGGLINSLNEDIDDVIDAVVQNSFFFLYLAAATFVASFLQLACWMYTAETQTKACREAYLESVVSQNIGWFDDNTAGALQTQLNNDSIKFQDAIGDKVGRLIQNLTTFVAGIGVGYYRGYQLALVVTACLPLVAIIMGVLMGIVQKFTKQTQDAYKEAGEICIDSLGSVRTVTAFGQQNREFARYSSALDRAYEFGVKKGITGGLAMGMFNLVLFSSYGLSLWYGGKLIREGTLLPRTDRPYNGGDVLSVFFAVIIGAMTVGQAGPIFPVLAEGCVSAYRLFQVIDRKSEIDSRSNEGLRPKDLKGKVQLEKIGFHYPTRPDVPIFTNLSISISPGQQVAIVGPSGGGKSTIISLMERLYDPTGGRITVDGMDIRHFNVGWWRKNLGLVAQEPILFQCSIFDNIRYGKPNATREEVIKAAKASNAHEFIQRLGDGYDTNAGESGHLLSGGQKQRIAIARAIIRNPKILLLDEATSALDNESEKVVQEALDSIMKDRTTIIVAHRLSTIRNVDKIIVVQEGRVVEQGTHDVLMAKRGAFYHLVLAQDIQAEQKGEEGEVEIEIPAPEEFPIDEEIVSPRTPKDFMMSPIRKGSRSRSSVGTPLLEHKDSISHRDSLSHAASLSKSRTAKNRKTSFIDIETDDAPKDVKWEVDRVPILRVVKETKDDWLWSVLGCIGAIVSGITMPLFAIIFSRILNVFFLTDPDEMKRQSAILALVFFGLGVAQLGAYFFKGAGFAIVGERLTRKLREASFRAIMRQEIGWFDEDAHNSRVLAARLETDTSLVHGVTTSQLGAVFEMFFLLVTGIAVAFVFSYQMALIVLALIIPLIGVGAIQVKIFAGFSDKDKSKLERAGQVSGDAMAEIRTVAAFTSEDLVLRQFSEALVEPLKTGMKRAVIAGLGLGLSQAVLFSSYALLFWYGSTLIHKQTSNFQDIMTAIFAIITAAFGVGQVQQMSPDFEKAVTAASYIFYLLDRTSSIDPTSEDGKKLQLGAPLAGERDGEPRGTAIEMEDVRFAYPTRLGQDVLKGLSFEVEPGCNMALVGENGSGKSTVISLLLRFYDSATGNILLDRNRVKDLHINHYRDQIGLVSQEPDLFNISVRENIRYGRPDATDEQVIEAAKAANIHESILGFTDGYDTKCGTRGSLISGGQKQRVAIARAIIRNPKVLLLDEATSSLDTKSEKLVQAALDQLMSERFVSTTTIVIAHRLSTVRNCDKILVIDKGELVEVGSHDDLIARNGVYANLVRAAKVV